MARAIPQTEAMFQSLFQPCIGSQGETPFSLRQGKMFSARTSNFATLTQPFQRFQRFLWSVNCTTWPLTLVTLSMASSIDQSSCLSPNIMVPMKLFKPDHMRGFQNIIDIGKFYGIITNNEYPAVLSCKYLAIATYVLQILIFALLSVELCRFTNENNIEPIGTQHYQ